MIKFLREGEADLLHYAERSFVGRGGERDDFLKF
jgi:hypothetical protein